MNNKSALELVVSASVAHKLVPPGGVRKQAARSEKRRAEILDAARAVFLEHGYSGASIDAIVARAGGSKETVYCYFGNKEGLMTALIERTAGRFFSDLDGPMEYTTLEQGLFDIARRFLAHILSPDTLAVFRLVLAESGRKPEWGDLYYRVGPESFTGQVTRFFSHGVGSTLAATADPRELATAFISMLRGDLHLRSLFNPTRIPTAAETDRHIQFVIGTMLRTYGRESCERMMP